MEGDGAVGQVGARPGSSGVHAGHPFYKPGSRPSAGLLRSFLVGRDFLAAKKMGSMSASLWCLAGDREPQGELVREHRACRAPGKPLRAGLWGAG